MLWACLSLCVSDTIKAITSLCSCLDTTHEICNLIRYSPKCARHLKGNQVNMRDHGIWISYT